MNLDYYKTMEIVTIFVKKAMISIMKSMVQELYHHMMKQTILSNAQRENQKDQNYCHLI